MGEVAADREPVRARASDQYPMCGGGEPTHPLQGRNTLALARSSLDFDQLPPSQGPHADAGKQHEQRHQENGRWGDGNLSHPPRDQQPNEDEQAAGRDHDGFVEADIPPHSAVTAAQGFRGDEETARGQRKERRFGHSDRRHAFGHRDRGHYRKRGAGEVHDRFHHAPQTGIAQVPAFQFAAPLRDLAEQPLDPVERHSTSVNPKQRHAKLLRWDLHVLPQPGPYTSSSVPNEAAVASGGRCPQSFGNSRGYTAMSGGRVVRDRNNGPAARRLVPRPGYRVDAEL